MEENLKSKLGFGLFAFVILILFVGGYFFTDYVINYSNSSQKEDGKNKIINHKIDKNKDYIYFRNEEVISEKAEIYYKDVVINLDTQSVLNESLEKENKMYKDNIKYISEMNLMTNEVVNYNNDDLYALYFREYKTYEFDKYISLVIIDQYYSCFDLNTFYKTKAYVFDTENGKLISEEKLLKLNNITMEEIKKNISDYLEEKQVIKDDKKIINIEDTLESFNNYALYLNEYGRLYISFLVKSSEVDYNEIMEVK